MSEIEQLRQMVLGMAAELDATRLISQAAFAMMCSFDGSPEMLDKLKNGIFPLLLQQAENAPMKSPQPELDRWLRDKTKASLEAQFASILAEIDATRQRAKRQVN